MEDKNRGLEEMPAEVTYIKIDSEEGFVTGEHDVNHMKTLRFKDVIRNDLVGDFDEKGNYIIAENIEVDLVNLTKKIDANTINGVEGRAFVDDRVYKFNVTPPRELGNGNAYCYLQLLEELPRLNGYYVDTLTSVVATYEYKFDEFFMDKALEAFNFKEFDGDETEITERLPDSLRVRLEMLAAIKAQAYDPLDKLEEAYFNKRLQLLAEDPELSVILAEFANRRNKLEPYFDKAEHRFMYLNELLDEVLDLEVSKKALEKSPTIKEQLVEADKKAYNLAIKVEEKVREDNPLERAEKKALFTDMSKEKPAPAKPKNPAVRVNKGGGGKDPFGYNPKQNDRVGYTSPNGKGGKKGDKGKDEKKPSFDPPKKEPQQQTKVADTHSFEIINVTNLDSGLGKQGIQTHDNGRTM